MVPQQTYEGMLATPLEVDDIVAGEMLWCATKGLFSSSAILLVSFLLGAISHWQALLCIPLSFLTGLCFAGPAIIVASFSRSYDFFNYYVTLVLTPMFIFCGVFYPIASLPDFAQSLVQLLPLSHAIALIRPLATGQEPTQVIAHLSVPAGVCPGQFLLGQRFWCADAWFSNCAGIASAMQNHVVREHVLRGAISGSPGASVQLMPACFAIVIINFLQEFRGETAMVHTFEVVYTGFICIHRTPGFVTGTLLSPEHKNPYFMVKTGWRLPVNRWRQLVAQ